MTTFEKSKRLWWGGGIVGAIAGLVMAKHQDKGPVAGALGGAALGAILVGAIGDKMLERAQQEQRNFPR